MRILVTGAGGAAAISVWKSLNADHELYMADADHCATGLYLVPKSQRFIIPSGHSPNFVDYIFQECQKRQIEVLIPTVDSELVPLASSIDKFLNAGIKIPISSKESLQLCRDKYLLLTFCKDKTPIPETVLLTSENISPLDKFPLFSKPRLGAGSQNANVIKNMDELLQLPKDGTYILQELLPGEEFSVDVYVRSDGHPIAAVPRLRMKIDSGIAVAARTLYLPDLMEQALTVAKLLQLRYVANIQFKRDTENKFKLLEINPRFPGTLPLTAASGIDIPKLMMKDLNKENLADTLIAFKETMVVRYWTEHFCSPTEWEELCRQKQQLG